MVDKLEACTWCGHEGVLHSSSDGEIEWVRCVHCGRESPLAYSAEEAIRRWNAGEVRGVKPTPANGEQVERVARVLCKHNTGDERNWGMWVEDARVVIAAMDATPTEDARSRIKALEEAARPIVAKLEHSEASFARYRAVHPYEDDINGDDGVCVSVADLRALRTALGNKETDRHG